MSHSHLITKEFVMERTIESQDLKKLVFGDLTLFTNDECCTTYLYKEIFLGKEYPIASTKSHPLIVDCGSNIGISVLFFKKKYPNGKIIAFEPDPMSYSILNKNVSINGLKNVQLYNLALSDKEGECLLYGCSTNSIGQSLSSDWGLKGYYKDSFPTKVMRLSSFIDEEVDFLKLDIEGAEQAVLQDLHKNNKLLLIKQFTIEVHEIDAIANENNMQGVVEILDQYPFQYSIFEHPISELPMSHLQEWAQLNNMKISVIKGTREKT